jgi:ABC-type uncharacterized transport system permease subunit
MNNIALSRLKSNWPFLALAAVATAFLIFAAIVGLYGANSMTAVQILLFSGWSSGTAIAESLVKTAPLIMCGLAAAIPGKLKLINIGGDGQFTMGAIGAGWIVTLAPGVPLMLLVSAIFGGVWGFVPGLLRSRTGTNETVISIILNFIAFLLLLYLIHGPLQDGSTPGWPQGALIPDPATIYPLIPGTRINILLPASVFLCLGAYWVFKKTSVGPSWRIIGENKGTARILGINTNLQYIYAFLIAGAIAGLAGGVELAAIDGRLREGLSMNYGYIGLLIAWLVRLRLQYIPIVSLFFAGLLTAADSLQIETTLPNSAINILIGALLVTILIAEAVYKYSYGN